MKKTVSIVLIAFAINIGLSSCSKAYNCHCVYATNGVVNHEDNHKINEGKKEKSADSCNKGDNVTTTTTSNGYTSTTTTECELN
ncbi:MAG: hypothetical protein Q7W45_01290 [Bacteroidota bacterium]|nr:hypothetical protein [Bacteroidota bacterium]MDP3146512.1 hypothetical protein [Bacteroidota bacterium]